MCNSFPKLPVQSSFSMGVGFPWRGSGEKVVFVFGIQCACAGMELCEVTERPVCQPVNILVCQCVSVSGFQYISLLV